MTKPRVLAAFIVSLAVYGCDDAPEAVVVPVLPGTTTAPTATTEAVAPVLSREGTMTFRIDGEEHVMTHFQPGSNVIMGRLGVNIQGRLTADSDEELEISITHFQIADATLPAFIESEPLTGGPTRMLRISYDVGEDHFVNRGGVFLDSLDSGVLTGHIDELRLVGHSGAAEGRSVTLSELRFQIDVEH